MVVLHTLAVFRRKQKTWNGLQSTLARVAVGWEMQNYEQSAVMVVQRQW